MADQPNPIVALIAFLDADTDVDALLATGKIFGAELPDTEAENMPQKCIVIVSSGGPEDRGFIRAETRRVDLKCYGRTPIEADAVYLAAKNALKQMDGNVQGNTLLYSATLAGGPVQLRDGDQDWPLVLGTFNVFVAEVATA